MCGLPVPQRPHRASPNPEHLSFNSDRMKRTHWTSFYCMLWVLRRRRRDSTIIKQLHVRLRWKQHVQLWCLDTCTVRMFKTLQSACTVHLSHQPILDGRKHKSCKNGRAFRTEKKFSRRSKIKLKEPKQARLPFLLLLPCVARLLPARLSDLPCAPPTPLVALRPVLSY